jgi:hypothetical protein
MLMAIVALSFGLASGSVAQAQTLYGAVGRGGANQHSLWTINTSNANATMVFSFPVNAAENGNAIAYNTSDNLMYYWTGFSGSGGDAYVMANINLSTFSFNQVSESGDTRSEIFGATFDAGAGRFLANEISGSHYAITPGGAFSNLGPTPLARGYAFVAGSLLALERFDSFNGDGNTDLLTLNPADGSVTGNIAITTSFTLSQGVYGLAFDSNNGILYGTLGDADDGLRHLVSIDPATGAATDIGALPDSFGSLAFVPGAAVPEPATFALGAVALGGVALTARRVRARRKARSQPK